MDWIQLAAFIFTVLVFILTVAGMFMWQRTESRSDIDKLNAKIDELTKLIYQDMREFHGRLCTVEEKTKGIT